ncbi:MAG: ATP-binding protein [Planctomycetaceae bacterium]|nr:ATP-binding protein [Planctomycetaceae bacterium]
MHVTNFAGIREADIELAPLTLFVGDNNSGKTYLSSLIWGLDDLPFWRFPLENDLPHSLQSLLDGIGEVVSQTETERDFTVSQEVHDAILKSVNTYLQNEHVKCRWMAEIFGKDVSIGEVFLSIPYREGISFFLKKRDNETRPVIRYEIRQPKNSDSAVSYQSRVFSPRLGGTLTAQTILRMLTREYWKSCWGQYYYLQRKSFFPDSRNGLLLANPSIVKDLKGSLRLRRFLRPYQFTAPQTQFVIGLDEVTQAAKNSLFPSQDVIRKMGRIYYDGRVVDIVAFIEKEMIGGAVIASDASLPELLYQPENSAIKFSMNISSGVITSIAPILASLKYGNIGNRCFIDEPEISLHPALQRQMAQVLVRLANSIGFVLVSTHSDIITQHVNNMIKLSNRSDIESLLKEYDYDHKDVISADKVRMYQFEKPAGSFTDVKPLEHGVNGFRLPTFGKVFRKMQDETWNLRIEKEEAKP